MSVYRSVGPLVRPSVCPSVGASVPCYFRMTKIDDFDKEIYLNDKINNATISDDEVVASYGPPRSLFFRKVAYRVACARLMAIGLVTT